MDQHNLDFPAPQVNTQLHTSTQYASIVGDQTLKLGREVNFASVSTKDSTTLAISEKKTVARPRGLSIAKVIVTDNIETTTWLIPGSYDASEYSCDIPLQGSRNIKGITFALDGIRRIPICALATEDDMTRAKWSQPPVESRWTPYFTAHANIPNEVVRTDGEGFLDGRDFLVYRSFFTKVPQSSFQITMFRTETDPKKATRRSLLKVNLWPEKIGPMYIVIPGGYSRRYQCQMPISDKPTQMDVYFQSEL